MGKYVCLMLIGEE